MICSLLAYDADGNVVATLDHMVARDAEGNVIGLIDFAAHEAAGGEHTDTWRVSGGQPEPLAPGASGPRTSVPGTEWTAKGSKVWPEWLGGQAHAFRVELAGSAGGKHIAALVHKESGYRRERAATEAAIGQRIAAANGSPADIRDIVGGPGKPLILDEHGRNSDVKPSGTPAHLPLIGALQSA